MADDIIFADDITLALEPSLEPHILPIAQVAAALPSALPRRSRASLAAATASGNGNLTWANVFANELTTTLIDTVATPMGYVPHPLERILGGLDWIMLRLETAIAKLWQWLKQAWT
jgi:hypothetical protein